MATCTQHRIVTSRDLEVLTALDRTPLTAMQLLKLSQTFDNPFGSERMVRERLQALGAAGWVRADRYATTNPGAAPNYYFLSRLGYGILYGEASQAPTKRYFAPIGLARQHHTHSLAEFLVHTIVGTHRHAVRFTNFYRENTLRLRIGDESLYPDSSFQLVPAGEAPRNFFVELDNHTERIRSQQDIDNWERKLRLYDMLQSAADNRFRLLIITTRCGERLRHILAAAAAVMHNPDRRLCYGISLPDYLQTSDPLRSDCFRDHRFRPVALWPVWAPPQQREITRSVSPLASAPVCC